MSFTFKLDKLIAVKEREKNEIVEKYNRAVDSFEEVAQKLYELLKQKEQLEHEQESLLQEGLSIQRMNQLHMYLAHLQSTIDQQQQLVIQSRGRMDHLRQATLEATIEIKKFEKVKEKSHQKYMEEMKVFEQKQMDEVSLQQYMHRGN